LKRVVPQESQFPSPILNASGFEPEISGSYRRVQTSAAMLGLALSFGVAVPLLVKPELALAADGSTLTVLPAANREEFQAFNAVSSQDVGASSYHTVEPGENLWEIASQHDLDIHVIKAANGIAANEVLRAGQVIRVPAVGMDNLPTASDSSRLALQADGLGGVGGDMVAVADLATSEVVPLVGDLDAVATLESFLVSANGDELTEEELAAKLATLSAEEAIALGEALATNAPQSEVNQIAAAPAQSVALWPVSDAQAEESADVSDGLTSRVSAPSETVEAAETDSPTPVASLPLHGEDEQPRAAAPVQPSSHHETAASVDSKKDLVAVLPLGVTSPSAVSETTTLRSYQVKPGDTLWSIATRNNLTLDELLSQNQAVESPEALAVGDRLSLPSPTAEVELATVTEPVSRPTSSLAVAPQTREEAIRDHLARIRESNASLVDRDELNARIREARLELGRSRSTVADAPSSSLEYQSPESVPVASTSIGGPEPVSDAALMAREGAQPPATQWTVTDVAQEASQPVVAFSPAVETVVEQQPEAAEASQQLLAAAPLGADAYRTSPNLPVGQSVSPSMPMMPGASEFLPEAPRLSNGYIWPTTGTFTSGYGQRWGRMHRGIDIAAPVGTPVVAAASGVVVQSGWNSGGYGNLVDIRHADGSMTRYAHNSRLLVREGEQVRQGQQISAMGSTGYSTGPHLHFEVHLPNSGTVNPMAYLPAR